MHFIGRTGLGWTQIELTLVRLNTSEVPNATFPLTAPLTVLPGEFEAVGARMGIDAAICVEAIEPWVVEVFNSSVGVGAGGGQVGTRRIVKRGDSVLDSSSGNEGGDGNENDEVDVVVESGGREDGTGKIKEVVRVGTALSSNDRFSAFNDAHQNAVNRMLKVWFVSHVVLKAQIYSLLGDRIMCRTDTTSHPQRYGHYIPRKCITK